MQQKIKDILNHQGLNRAYIAQKLYPAKNERAASAKLLNKLNNTQGRNFTEQETAQIIEILKEFGKMIQANLGEPVAEKQEQTGTNGGEKISEEKTKPAKIDPAIFRTK